MSMTFAVPRWIVILGGLFYAFIQIAQNAHADAPIDGRSGHRRVDTELTLFADNVAKALAFKHIETIDLAQKLQTKSQWQLIITQEPNQVDIPGGLHICFLNEKKSTCYYVGDNVVDQATVIRPPVSPYSAFVLTTYGCCGGPDLHFSTMRIWNYDRVTDNFFEVFWSANNILLGETSELLQPGPPILGNYPFDIGDSRCSVGADRLARDGAQ